jgi:glutamate-5-semialdehyde dehydrogenase
MSEQAAAARRAVATAPPVGDPAYDRYCAALAGRLAEAWPAIRKANERDLAAAAERGLPPTLVERLRLTDRHVESIADLAERVRRELPAVAAGVRDIPAGDCVLHRLPKPLGVVLMVYEARPTVTVDGALLPVAVGNAVLLRGGRESAATDAAIGAAARAALSDAGLPADLVTVLDDPHRAQFRALLKRPDLVDVLIPRGSPSLVEHCRTAGTIPLIASGGGVNHLYVHRDADPALAATVTLDSKLPEPAGCTSVELVLAHREVAVAYLAALRAAVLAGGAPLTVRLHPGLADAGPADGAQDGGLWRTEPLGPHDLGREFLDPVIAVLPVAGPDEAVAHIRRYGSGHTEGVLAADPAVADEFARRVDAAMVVRNGSLRLHDGPRLSMGAELAIATGRLHARGPVTLSALVTHTWVVDGNGALRG